MTAKKLILRIDDLLVLDPLTETQGVFFNSWRQHQLHVLMGSAGTGKTFISIYKALEDVLDKGNKYKQLLILRSVVPARDVGHLPGDLEEKIAVYELPYDSFCGSLFNRRDAYTRLKEQGVVQFAPTSFLRGTTFDNTIILVDEIQNLNYQELYSVMTRVGEHSKIVFCGDFKQTDLKDSGLTRFLRVLETMKASNIVTFTVEDVVRSALVKEFIIAEEKLK